MNSLIAVFLGILAFVGGYLFYQDYQQQLSVGGFSDPFISLQLAASPQNGYILQTDGTTNSWVVNSGSGAAVFGDLGDVSTSSDATGDVYYLNASGQITNLGIGGSGQVLKVSGGLPSWGTDNTGAGGGSGSVGTSTPDVDTYVTYFTSNSATPALIGGESAFTYDDAGNLLTVTNASTTQFTNSGLSWFNGTSTWAAGVHPVMHGIYASDSSGLHLHSNNGTEVAYMGAGGGANITFPGYTSAILLTGATGAVSEYTGTTCTNQFTRALSALGVATCETVDLTADVTGVLPDANVADDITASNYLALSNWYSTTTKANLVITESQISDLTHYTDTDTADYINASTTLLKVATEAGLEAYLTDVSNVVTNNDDLFLVNDANDSTTGLLTIGGGIISQASSTIGAGTQTSGLSINGGATTTLVHKFLGAPNIEGTTPTLDFTETDTSKVASLQMSGGHLTINVDNAGVDNIVYNTNIDPSGWGVVDNWLPASDNTYSLGTGASSKWSDLFLGSGAVVNFNNGDVTLTHSSNLLTVAGGDFVVSGNATTTQFAVTSLTTCDLKSDSVGHFYCGTDATGGGNGLATSTAIADTWILYGTSANDAGAEAAFTYDDATDRMTVVYASTTALTATDADITKLGNLTSNGFIKTSGSDGTLSIDTNTYLTGNQTVTLSGDVTGSGATAITTAIADDVVAYTDILYNLTLAGNPALGANECYFGTNGLICEGATANNFEALFAVPTLAADVTYTYPNSSITVAGLASAMTGTFDGNNFGGGAIGLNQMLYGSSAGTIGEINAGTSAQLLQANGSGVPTFVSMSGDATIAAGGALTVANDAIEPNMVKSAGQTDEYCLTYEATGTTWEWQTCGGGSSIFTASGDFNYITTNPSDRLFIGTSTDPGTVATMVISATSSDTVNTLELYDDTQDLVFQVADTGETTIGTGASVDSTITVGTTGNEWSQGFDVTDSAFVISSSTALGTNNKLHIPKTGTTTATQTQGFDFTDGTNGMRIIIGATTTLQFY